MPDYGIGRFNSASGRSETGRAINALHVVTANQWRGAEVFAVDLADTLVGHDVGGHAVALGPGAAGDPLGVPVLGGSPLGVATLRALRRQAQRVEMVVAHGSKTLPACASALIAMRTPFVYRSIGDPAAWSGQGLRRRRTSLLLRRAAAVVALWPGAADALSRLHGVRPQDVEVIPNGVPAARCPVADDDERVSARRSLGVPPEPFIAAYVGALSAEKDVATAIAATAPLKEVHLLIVGDGPDRARLDHSAERVAPGRVHFAGSLPGPQTALAASDLVVLPSRTEGMPGILIEAAFSGRPAVASDVGGVSQIVQHGTTGMLAQPGNPASFTEAMRAVLDDPHAFGQAARQHCLARFEIDIVAAQWAELLYRVSGASVRRS